MLEDSNHPMGPNASTRATRTAERAALALFGGWLSASVIACGPAITLESEGSDDGEPTAGTDSGPPPPGTATTPPMPDTTASELDTGELDTGELDTGAPWMDLPEDCSIIEQDCPPGYKCMPYASEGDSWNDNECMPVVDDPQGVGEPCTVQGSATSGLDDCDATSMCWDVDPETNMGTCVAHCIGSYDQLGCLEPCNTCIITSDFILALCLTSCDPVEPNCPMGQGCYSLGSGFRCFADGSERGAAAGTPCEFTISCPPGLQCVGAEAIPGCAGSLGCCSPVCPVGGADPCPASLPGTECVPWYEDGSPFPESCFATEPGVCLAP